MGNAGQHGHGHVDGQKDLDSKENNSTSSFGVDRASAVTHPTAAVAKQFAHAEKSTVFCSTLNGSAALNNDQHANNMAKVAGQLLVTPMHSTTTPRKSDTKCNNWTGVTRSSSKKQSPGHQM